jgi:hypothetical protein
MLQFEKLLHSLLRSSLPEGRHLLYISIILLRYVTYYSRFFVVDPYQLHRKA